jgi:LysR family hydrogen peroxide-inducible transcriptional activator
VARAGHFGRAASACSVSKPALSQQILALEALCGTPLFDRLKSGVRPTPFGRSFLDLAQGVIDSAEALEAFALGPGGRPARPLQFGLIPTVAPYLLPEIFPALTAAFPDLAFTIIENRTDALIAGLFEGSLDMAVIGTEPPDSGPGLVSRALFHDPFMLATSRAQAAAGPVSLDDVAPERILLLDEGHCLRDQAIAACRFDKRPAARTFAATSLSTIVEFVANGQGVTLLPQIALRKEATDPRIAIHPVASSGASRILSLVWRQATPFTPIFERIADLIRQAPRPGSGPA